ncbi:MAG: Trm112 family protein [Ilumatobacteraceae bacterium]
MTLDTQLLSILACPQDKGPLYYFSGDEFLYNPRLARKYLIRDGIPIMLIDESVAVDDLERSQLQGRIESEGIQPTFGQKS